MTEDLPKADPPVRYGSVRGTGAFAAAAIAQRMIGLLLLPIFARVLSPAEYGQIAVIITIVGGIGAVMSLGLETAIFRSYVQASGDRSRRLLVNTLGTFALLVPIGIGTVLAVTAAMMPSVWGIEPAALSLAILGGAANVGLTLVPLALLRAQERFGDYLRMSLLHVAISTTLAILFVIVLRSGVPGWAAASALSGVAGLAAGLLILGHRWRLEFDGNIVKGALVFGVPLVPHALAHWGLALSDRAILGAYVPGSEVGLYFIAFQACLPITVLAVALTQASQPTHARAANSGHALQHATKLATGQVMVVALTTAAVVLMGPPLIRLLLPESYHAAGELLPWLAIGSSLFGMYLIPMNALSVMAGRTRWIWTVTVFAGLVNVALNLLMVPSFGTFAAAINKAIGYGVLLLGVSLMLSMREHRLKLEGLRIAAGVGVVLSISSIGLAAAPPEPLAALATSTLFVLLAVFLVVLLLFSQEVKSAVSVIASWRGRAAS